MLYNGVNYCSPVRDGDLEVKIIITGSNLWNTRLGCRHLGFFPDMGKVRFPGIIFKEGCKKFETWVFWGGGSKFSLYI